MRCFHLIAEPGGKYRAFRVRASHAADALTPCPSHTPLSLGLSVFHARLAQLSTRDLACLS